MKKVFRLFSSRRKNRSNSSPAYAGFGEAEIKVKAEQSNALPFALVANLRLAYGALGAGTGAAAPGACISFCSSNSAFR